MFTLLHNKQWWKWLRIGWGRNFELVTFCKLQSIVGTAPVVLP